MWRSSVTGAAYTTLMWTATVTAHRALTRRIPLRDARSAALHIGGISAAAAVAFGVVSAADYAICTAIGGDPKEISLGVIVGVAFGATVIVTTVLYLMDFFRRLRQAESAAVLAELRALRAQVNPHFLFNALNSVAALARTRPREAETVTERLADLFRYTLRASDRPTVPLDDELEAIRLYAAVEGVRFGDRLQVLIEVPDALRRVSIPSLALQPLVENAVKHGLSRTEDACAVRVHAQTVTEADGPLVEVTVRDTGPGFETTGPEVFERGTGLRNVRDRLRLVFGSRTAFEVLPDGVCLRFPLVPFEVGRPVAALASVPASVSRA
ncbi:MAG: histidine kinase [Bacteroidota bacterium]